MEMNQKERLNRTLQFKAVDRVPFFEIALWEQTVLRWNDEGLPDSAADADLFTGSEYFNLEGYDLALFNLTFPEPCPPDRRIKENERYITFIDGMGRTRLALKEGTVKGMRASMDTYVDFPIKTRNDFLLLKEKYINNAEDRIPRDWGSMVVRLAASARPSTFLDRYFASFGYYSMLRNWMGTEGLSYMFYDDPGLVHDCLNFLTEFITSWMEAPLREAAFDLYYIHEDMAGKNGPLVSPEMFRKFFSPYYRRLLDFLKRCGVKNIIVDTDGNFEALIPAFLDVGVEGFGPIERAAHLNPLDLRKNYGTSFFMIGGIDKRMLKKGKTTVENELLNLLPPLLEQGGYIPTIDHSVPPDVSLRSFESYLELKWKIINGQY
jgi:uroporphyrinogen-III decarboxylase